MTGLEAQWAATATMTAPLVLGIVVAMLPGGGARLGVRGALSLARREPGPGALVLPYCGSG